MRSCVNIGVARRDVYVWSGKLWQHVVTYSRRVAMLSELVCMIEELNTEQLDGAASGSEHARTVSELVRVQE